MARTKKEDKILTGRAKQKETENLHKKEWRFPFRTCKECVNYPCFRGIENSKANFAKYGCVNFEKKEVFND